MNFFQRRRRNAVVVVEAGDVEQIVVGVDDERIVLVASNRETLDAHVVDRGLAAIKPHRAHLIVLFVPENDAIALLHDFHGIGVVLERRRRGRLAIVFGGNRFIERFLVGEGPLV